MSETVEFEEMPNIISRLNDDWRRGPHDRYVTGIEYFKHKNYGNPRWSMSFELDGERSTGADVKVKDGEIILYGASWQLGGQVQKWIRYVGLLTVLVGDERFRRLIR